uniref:Uncharacterized protein n=1 Tax=Rhodnius prolixus TaxID=13249 RepID=T1IAW9_RHOPR
MAPPLNPKRTMHYREVLGRKKDRWGSFPAADVKAEQQGLSVIKRAARVGITNVTIVGKCRSSWISGRQKASAQFRHHHQHHQQQLPNNHQGFEMKLRERVTLGASALAVLLTLGLVLDLQLDLGMSGHRQNESTF